MKFRLIFDHLSNLRDKAMPAPWRQGSTERSIWGDEEGGAWSTAVNQVNDLGNANFIIGLVNAFDELKDRDEATRKLLAIAIGIVEKYSSCHECDAGMELKRALIDFYKSIERYTV